MASDQLLQIPVGYRFEPTDEELIAYYLTKKAKGERLPWDIIGDAEIYGDNEPWKIYGETSSETFYVFTKLKKKGNGKKRIDRIAGSGTWKDQRKDPVKDSKGNVIGFRRLLSFEVKGLDRSKHRGKGHWIMHEYSLLDDNQSYVLCTLRNKDGIGDNADQPPSKRMKTGHLVEDRRAAVPVVPVTEFEGVYAEDSIDEMNNLVESNQFFSTGLLNESQEEMKISGSVDDDPPAATMPTADLEKISWMEMLSDIEHNQCNINDLLGPKR